MGPVTQDCRQQTASASLAAPAQPAGRLPGPKAAWPTVGSAFSPQRGAADCRFFSRTGAGVQRAPETDTGQSPMKEPTRPHWNSPTRRAWAGVGVSALPLDTGVDRGSPGQGQPLPFPRPTGCSQPTPRPFSSSASQMSPAPGLPSGPKRPNPQTQSLGGCTDSDRPLPAAAPASTFTTSSSVCVLTRLSQVKWQLPQELEKRVPPRQAEAPTCPS